MRTNLLVAVAACTLLGACDTLDLKRTVSEDNLATLHRVGVVSLIGDDLHVVTRGLTVFGNSAFDATLPEWQIDATAQDRVLADLSRNPAFQSVRLERESLSIKDLDADEGRALYELAQRQGFDTVVVVRPGVSQNYAYLPAGVGIFNHTLPGMSPHPVAYAGFVVSVVSVGERKQKAWEWGGVMPFEMGKENIVPMHERLDQFSPDDKTRLRERVVERIDKGIDYALVKLHLVPRVESD